MRTQVPSQSAWSALFSGIDSGENIQPNWWLLGLGLALCLLGWVFITSASLDYANYKNGDALYYFYRHGIYLVLAFCCALAVLLLSVDFWKRFAAWLLLGSFLLLFIILIPGVGYTANNATRWLSLGVITVQVSEIAKIGVLVYLSSYLVRQRELVRSNIFGFINPMLVIMLLVGLLLAQPDFGAVVVILGASLGLLFIGGVRIWQFGLLVLAAVAAIAVMVLSEEYRMARLIAYLDPWAHSQTGGYQLVQSLIAFGRGDLFGLGLGNSIQKLFFLPEAHTDFIFAVIAEELGLLGCLVVLAIYSAMLLEILRVALRADKAGANFAAYLAYGIALVFSIQLFISVGVNTGLLPTKGLTLPFISYGGSSLLVSAMFLAMVLRIDWELKQQAQQQQQRKGGVVNELPKTARQKSGGTRRRGSKRG